MKYDLIKLQKDFRQVGIEIVFVDERAIQRLNKKYRGLDETTSVLSFYHGQVGIEGTYFLGEILICPGQAKEKGLSIGFLVNHGLKNLLSEIPAAKNRPARRHRHP